MALHQQFFGTVMDHLAGMKEAKSLGSEQRHIDEFNQTSAAIKETLLRYTRARENTTLAYKVGSAGFLSLLLYLAVELLQVPLVALMLLIIIFARLFSAAPRDSHGIPGSSPHDSCLWPAYGAVGEPRGGTRVKTRVAP